MIEIVSVCRLAESLAERGLDPIRTMMNEATSSSVAVSFGSFGLKRMMPRRSARRRQ